MRSGLIFAMCLFAVPPATADSKKPAQVVYESATGKYKATFPGEPKTDSKDYPTPKGLLPITTDRHESPRGDCIVSVTFSDYPAAYGAVMPKIVFDGVQKALADGSKEITEKPASIQLGDTKYEGRELLMKFGSGRLEKVVRVRMILVKRRLYQIMAVGTGVGVQKPEVNELFDSFQLKE